jgi:hypothetical protein
VVVARVHDALRSSISNESTATSRRGDGAARQPAAAARS